MDGFSTRVDILIGYTAYSRYLTIRILLMKYMTIRNILTKYGVVIYDHTCRRLLLLLAFYVVLKSEMVPSLPKLQAPWKHVCEGCILGKMQRSSFPKYGSVRATQKLQLVHSDVCGPMQTHSLGNYLYFMTFIDDFSRHAWV